MSLRGSPKRDALAVDHDDVPRVRDRPPVEVFAGRPQAARRETKRSRRRERERARRALCSETTSAPLRRFTGARRAKSRVSDRETGLVWRRWLKFRCDFEPQRVK